MAFFPKSRNGACLPGLVERIAFLAEDPRWRIMSFVTPSGPSAFLVSSVLISASSSSFCVTSVMHLSVGVFHESCFVSFLTCLPLLSFTVLSS